MRKRTDEMSLQSTFAWTAVAVSASVVTLAMIWGFEAIQTVATSSQPWPLAG